MPREVISIGPIITMIQNVIYAMPAPVVYIVSSGALQFSLDGSTWTADIAATLTGYQSTYPFVRAVGGNVTVVAKRA